MCPCFSALGRKWTAFSSKFSKKITRHHFDKSSMKTIDGTKIASTFKEFLIKFAVDLATLLSSKQCCFKKVLYQATPSTS